MRTKQNEAFKSRFDGHRVDPRFLKVTPGYNVRDMTTPQARERLDILKERIRSEGGVFVPLEIRMVNDEVHVVSGHRRLQAVLELIDEGLEIDTVPAILEPRTTSDSERTLRLITHNSGEPLTKLEEAEVIRRLLTAGWSREKIAQRLGYKSVRSIADWETLLSAPEPVREAVRQEEISASTAMVLLRGHGQGAAEKLPEIQQAAQERGAKKATIQDVKKLQGSDAEKDKATSQGTGVAQIERKNEQRLAEHQKGNSKPEGDLARLEKIITTLLEFEDRGVDAKTMADAFGTRKSEEVVIAAAWLYEFYEALKEKRGERTEDILSAEEYDQDTDIEELEVTG